MKYPVHIRIAAVRHYIAGRSSIKGTARLFGVGPTPLTRWIRAYRHQGWAGLEHRPVHAYTAEFRLRVVRYVSEKGCSYAEASARFAIPNESLILDWTRRYRKGGAQALKTAKSGPAMSQKKFIPCSKPLKEKTPSELQRELKYLRAENAYLLDMLAAIARKDYDDRRRRQAEGIKKAKAEGKYRGRVADAQKHELIRTLRLANGKSLR